MVRFWEKPPYEAADELYVRRCLWNTFVMIGSVGAFRMLLYSAVPDLIRAFEIVETHPAGEEAAVAQAYASQRPADFSRDVLAPHPDRAAVVRLPNVGWTDLGQPARVQTFLALHGSPPAAANQGGLTSRT